MSLLAAVAAHTVSAATRAATRERVTNIMKTTSTTNKVLAAVGAAAVAVVAPTVALFAAAGTAQADDVCTGPYGQGYSDGVLGGPGRCFLDPQKQSSFDSGFADGAAGRPENPPPPFSTVLTPNSGELPQTSMSPWDGSQGSWPEPPEFPEYDLPPEPHAQ